MRNFENDADYERTCFQLLENSLKQKKKKIILFIDNIDEMLSKFSKMEHHRLREVFMESAEIRVIGASSVSLEFHYDYEQPFYEFFRMPSLKGLTTEETKTLLLSLGEHYKRDRVREIVSNQPGRVEALRRLTGGVIRTTVILFQIFVDDTNGNAFMDLEKILDSVTPLYKNRMEKLSPQQQGIVDFIALNWDAVSAKEIAQKTNLKSKAVSSQIKQLEKYHILEKEKTDSKNYLYRIAERFFNIWYLMRSGRKWDEKRVRFLVEFLQIWCDEKELEKRALKHIEALKQKKLHEKQALYLTEALSRTPLRRELQHRLITETRTYMNYTQSKLKNYLCQSDEELQIVAIQAIEKQDTRTAIKKIEQIKNKQGEDFNALGICYLISQNIDNARDYFLYAVEKEHAGAMYNLALLYETEFKDLKNAEKYYLMAVEKEDAIAMSRLALMFFYQNINRQGALKYAKNAFHLIKEARTAIAYSMILMWSNEIDKINEISKIFLENQEALEGFSESITQFFLFLITRKQFYLALKLFNENPYNLKDRFKPIYYTLMHFMKNDFPNEYRKMGGELKETVEEIIEKIHKMEKDYK